MAAESKDNVDDILADAAKCNTCMACFSNTDKLKEHYRSEWHAYNSKRRAAGVRPIRKKEFKELAASLATSNSKHNGSSSSSKGDSKQRSAKLPSPAADASASLSKRQLRTLEKGGRDHTRAGAFAKHMAARAANKHRQGNVEEEADGEDEDDDDVELVDTFDEDAVLPVAPHISIFDDKQFSTTAECVQYMRQRYGFFLPDAEYISDLEGLLQYLGEKVKLGGYCLYCQKRMLPGRPAQSHMISKSHCKIRYEEGVDAEEFEDFYDFSASYADDNVQLDENGDVAEPEAEITASGELQLADGRVLGNRNYRRYYKQNHRTFS